MRIVTLDYVYAHLVCEFDHWDICLEGLIRDGRGYWYCEVADPNVKPVAYTLAQVEIVGECDEFLRDYLVAYKQWAYRNGRRENSHSRQDHSWFHEKWNASNPIEEQAKQDAG